MWGTLESLRTSVLPPGKPYHPELLSTAIKKKRVKVRAEGLWTPGFAQSRGPSQAHCRAMGTVWSVGQQLTCSCVWLPFLEPLFPSPDSPCSHPLPPQ